MHIELSVFFSPVFVNYLIIQNYEIIYHVVNYCINKQVLFLFSRVQTLRNLLSRCIECPEAFIVAARVLSRIAD